MSVEAAFVCLNDSGFVFEHELSFSIIFQWYPFRGWRSGLLSGVNWYKTFFFFVAVSEMIFEFEEHGV